MEHTDGSKQAAGTSGGEVFPTAFLVWIDAESGEEVGLALCGPDELVQTLLNHGFELRALPAEAAPVATARISRHHAGHHAPHHTGA